MSSLVNKVVGKRVEVRFQDEIRRLVRTEVLENPTAHDIVMTMKTASPKETPSYIVKNN